jgi:Na+/H+ antiporter NhaC
MIRSHHTRIFFPSKISFYFFFFFFFFKTQKNAKKRSTKATKHVGRRNNTVYIQPKSEKKKKKKEINIRTYIYMVREYHSTLKAQNNILMVLILTLYV